MKIKFLLFVVFLSFFLFIFYFMCQVVHEYMK